MTTSPFNVSITELASNVTTRPVAANARRRLLALLEEHEVVNIDFQHKNLTPSFADECIGQLAAQLGLEPFKQRVGLKNVIDTNKPLVRHVVLNRCSKAAA
jgi:hypothetical protein